MILEIDRKSLGELLVRQLSSLFLLSDDDAEVTTELIDPVLEACEYCFSLTENKYYHRNGSTYFSPYHSGQYTIFLYFAASLSHERHANSTLADKLYYLNKALNSVDMFYEIRLPRFFRLDHPVGSVLGRAVYGEGFSFSQGCTVGNNRGIYPTFGPNVQMLSGAKVIGQSHVGRDSVISANTYVKDADIPSGSLVFGSSPDLIIKRRT